MGRISMCFPAACSHPSTPSSSLLHVEKVRKHLPTTAGLRRQRGALKPPPQPQEHSPVSGSHWCSQGSRRRRAQRSRAQGPLEFCWEKRTTCAGFSQSLASSWLPSSRMNRLPATETRGVSVSNLHLLYPPSSCCTLHPMMVPCIPSIP